MGKVREVGLTLPIYYTQEFKTKKNKTFLVGLNWERNAHYFIKSEVKRHYHELVEEQVTALGNPFAQFEVHSMLYWKNKSSDPRNIVSLVEKYLLDGLQLSGIIKQDSAMFDMGGSISNMGQDKKEPRIEFVIREY